MDQLILENFKAFGSRQVIPLAPITLIFGANSAGKSSILQSLLLLKQTLDEAESPKQLFVFRGETVDVGSFQDLVFHHDLDRVVEISILNTRAKVSAVRHQRDKQPELPSGVGGIGIKFGYEVSSRRPIAKTIPVYLGSAQEAAYEVVLSPGKPGSGRKIMDRSYVSESINSEVVSGSAFETSIAINEDHDIWTTWWNDYRTQVMPQISAILEAIEDAVRNSQSLDFESNSNAIASYLMYQLTALTEDEHLLEDVDSKKSVNAQKRFEVIIGDIKARHRSYSLGDYLSDIARDGESSQVTFLRNYLLDIVNQDDRQSKWAALLFALQRIYEVLDDLTSRSNRPRTQLTFPDVAILARRIAQQQRRDLARMVYLGPLRGFPERQYIVGGRQTTSVGKRGDFTPDILFANESVAKRANDKIKEFGFGYELSMQELVPKDDPDGRADVFSVRLIDSSTNTNVSLADVGFGISQVLPVIVQSMLSRNNTIVIEQPEIHLHPRLQAELGSLLAECIRKPYANRFIVETHSEHLILRLQRLVRNGELNAQDISVLYVSRGDKDIGEGSMVSRLELDDDGSFIDNWPDGFFEEGFREMFAQ